MILVERQGIEPPRPLRCIVWKNINHCYGINCDLFAPIRTLALCVLPVWHGGEKSKTVVASVPDKSNCTKNVSVLMPTAAIACLGME